MLKKVNELKALTQRDSIKLYDKKLFTHHFQHYLIIDSTHTKDWV